MKVRLRIDENAGPNLESNQAENSAPNTFRRTNRISTLGSKKAAHSEMSSLKAAKESFFAYSLPRIYSPLRRPRRIRRPSRSGVVPLGRKGLVDLEVVAPAGELEA